MNTTEHTIKFIVSSSINMIWYIQSTPYIYPLQNTIFRGESNDLSYNSRHHLIKRIRLFLLFLISLLFMINLINIIVTLMRRWAGDHMHTGEISSLIF